MKLLNIFIVLGSLLILIKADLVRFRAKNVETLVIFTFATNSTELPDYLLYFANFVSLWKEIYKCIYPIDFTNFPIQLWFGEFNATDILKSADPQNTTSAIVILANNLDAVENFTTEADNNPFAECNDNILCNVVETFLNSKRDVLTKLNLVVVSDVCPHSSNFESFYNFGIGKIENTRTTSSFLIKTAREWYSTCKENNPYLDYHIIPTENFETVEDPTALIDPAFVYDVDIVNGVFNLFFIIDEENKDIMIDFITNFIYNSTLCKPNETKKDPYFIMIAYKKMVNNKAKYDEKATLIPWVDYDKEDYENYLRQNIEYTLNVQNGDDKAISTILKEIYLNELNGTDYQQNILFTDQSLENVNRLGWLKESLFQSSIAFRSRSLDIVFYDTSFGGESKTNDAKLFYNMGSRLNRESAINLHFINSTDNPGIFNHLSVCKIEVDPINFSTEKITRAMPWYFFALIGIFIDIIASVIIYLLRKKISFLCRWLWVSKRHSLKTIVIYMELTPEAEKRFKQICDKLHIGEQNILLNQNKVLGRGSSSTVVEAIILQASRFFKPHTIFAKTNEDELFVAAKISEKLKETELYSELETARKLQNHPNICALIGWTFHLDVPCLLFEKMDLNLQSYLISLRVASESDEISLSTSSSSHANSLYEHFGVPDFSEKQQKIFLQILWNIAQGLAYIASKNIVHRDVAARNILLTQKDGHFIAKIADFGLCCDCNEATNIYQSTNTKKLPLEWLSIEALSNQTFSQASDVWAFGIAMIEIYSLCGQLYPGIKHYELKDYLSDGNRIKKPEKMNEEMFDVAFSCWLTQSVNRPTFSQLENILNEMLRPLTKDDNYPYLIVCNEDANQ